MLEAALNHVHAGHDALLERYKALLAIPSVSTLPEHQGDVLRTAEWLAAELTRLGMKRVEIMPTGVHPVVFAASDEVAGKPTVLVYGHYDVQPVDPIDEWDSAPFEPAVRDDNCYARGASDMKGSLSAFLAALEGVAEQGELPVNLKFLLEGEEEIGSPSLPGFIEENKDLLKADVMLSLDSGIHSPELPAIVYSLRGLAYFEVEVWGPKKDLHSGVFGGAVHNPAQVLCELVAGMHDADGRVTLPGFYDNVRPLAEDERELLARVPFTDDDWKEMAGVSALYGEKGCTTVERIGARPTLDVNGIVSGFTGVGAKTVLPAKALAKISARLVADQDPAEIVNQLRAYMEANAPNTVRWEVRELSNAPFGMMDRKGPAIQVAAQALEETFGAAPIFKREGGSIPIVGIMQQLLGLDTVMLGFALPDDGVHGPNEKQHLPTLLKGVDVYVRFLYGLGETALA